jgi:fatty-acid desaturase
VNTTGHQQGIKVVAPHAEVASTGVSWLDSHHADPACARHGQTDISARVIWLLETLGVGDEGPQAEVRAFARRLVTRDCPTGVATR